MKHADDLTGVLGGDILLVTYEINFKGHLVVLYTNSTAKKYSL